MIIVDTNILAYIYLLGTFIAQAVRRRKRALLCGQGQPIMFKALSGSQRSTPRN